MHVHVAGLLKDGTPCFATEQPDFLNPEPHATAVYTDAFTQLHVLSRITLSQHVFERKTQ